jgi:predicted DNA-binding transcriptional regulator YafY
VERDHLDAFGKAIDGRQKVCFGYRDAEGSASRRTVRPLALQFWGQVWTLAAWCELREDFRTFRVDRVERLEVGPEQFPREAGRTLEDYLARITRAP